MSKKVKNISRDYEKSLVDAAFILVEVLELTLHDDIYLVMGVRDSKGEAGGP